jgi:probable HAF family extracellular repeat protein
VAQAFSDLEEEVRMMRGQRQRLGRAQALVRALISATVLSLMANTGWSQTLTWLGTLPRPYDSGSFANAVSADGSVVVGGALNPIDIRGEVAYEGYRAFRWTRAGGMQDLGTLPGGNWSEAWGVSADGSVVVGGAYNAVEQLRAFRWTPSGGWKT